MARGTDLNYHRGRWLDSRIGRWLSEDPIGFAGGDANLNRYVGNGPTNAVDPSGLENLSVQEFAQQVMEQNNRLPGFARYRDSANGAFGSLVRFNPANPYWSILAAEEAAIAGYREGAMAKQVYSSVCESTGSVGEGIYAAGGNAIAGQIGLRNIYSGGAGSDLELDASNQLYLRGLTTGEQIEYVATGTFQLGASGFGLSRPFVGAVQPSNAQLLQSIASRAERRIDKIGHAAGSMKHAYAKNLLDRYQRRYGHRGLFPEQSYCNGLRVEYGSRNSVRLDVVEGTIGNPRAIYDYKFGGARLSSGRIDRIYNKGGIGRHVPIIIIRP